MGAIDQITLPLVRELVSELKELIARAKGQIESPDVQALGLQHKITITGTTRVSASLSTD
jgi:hypothetical protein